MEERVDIPRLLVVGLVIAGFVLMIIGIIYFQRWNKKYGDFQSINLNTEINSKLHILRVYKGMTYLRMLNGEQIAVEELRNNLYQPPEFFNYILNEDSLVKRKNSDTLFVHRPKYDQPMRYYLLIKH
jgi:hypothetical protein